MIFDDAYVSCSQLSVLAEAFIYAFPLEPAIILRNSRRMGLLKNDM